MNTLIMRTKQARDAYIESGTKEDRAVMVALLDEVEAAGLTEALYS